MMRVRLLVNDVMFGFDYELKVVGTTVNVLFLDLEKTLVSEEYLDVDRNDFLSSTDGFNLNNIVLVRFKCFGCNDLLLDEPIGMAYELFNKVLAFDTHYVHQCDFNFCLDKDSDEVMQVIFMENLNHSYISSFNIA
jgi:hypothetical protein